MQHFSWILSFLPLPLRSLLREHDLLAVGVDGDELLMPHQHRLDDHIGGQSLADGEPQDTTRFFPGWTKLQRVLRRVILFLAVMTDGSPLPSNP